MERKTKYLDKRTQFVVFDNDGLVLDSCNTILNLKIDALYARIYTPMFLALAEHEDIDGHIQKLSEHIGSIVVINNDELFSGGKIVHRPASSLIGCQFAFPAQTFDIAFDGGLEVADFPGTFFLGHLVPGNALGIR